MFPSSRSNCGSGPAPLVVLRRVALALAVAASTAGAASARAGERRPLPDLRLTNLDGAGVSPSAVGRPGRWLLVYVQPESGACRALLRRIEPAIRRAGPAIVVVVGSSTESARELAASSTALGEASFYVDAAHEAYGALGLGGVPVILGVRGRTIEWTLAGVLADPGALESILTTWSR